MLQFSLGSIVQTDEDHTVVVHDHSFHREVSYLQNFSRTEIK